MIKNWSSRDDNTNYITNKNILKKSLISEIYNNKNTLFCFSHVPKTGGTSIESILSKNFDAADVLHINAPDLNRFPNLLQLKKHPPKLICGHHPMHGLLYQLLPTTPVFHLTMLRDPISRVISYYNYIKGKTDHPMHQLASTSHIVDFLASGASPELSNGQAKRFSGQLHLQHPNHNTLLSEAQDTLNDCFSLVLTTCLYDEGLLLIKNRMDLKDIFYHRRNVSKRFVSREQLTQTEMDLISELNQIDIQLFETTKTNCQKIIDAEITAEQLNTFRSNQLKWHKLIKS